MVVFAALQVNKSRIPLTDNSIIEQVWLALSAVCKKVPGSMHSFRGS